MICSIIAAISNNNIIGNKGRIPWNIPEDRLHFKDITLNHIVIFGRKTFEEIGKPLSGRINIVVSTTKHFKGENLYTAASLEKAVELSKKLEELAGDRPLKFTGDRPQNSSGDSSPDFIRHFNNSEFFICGGQKLYEEAINYADKLYLTRINADIKGDTFFPEIKKDRFELISESSPKIQNGLEFRFQEYKKSAYLL